MKKMRQREREEKERKEGRKEKTNWYLIGLAISRCDYDNHERKVYAT